MGWGKGGTQRLTTGLLSPPLSPTFISIGGGGGKAFVMKEHHDVSMCTYAYFVVIVFDMLFTDAE